MSDVAESIGLSYERLAGEFKNGDHTLTAPELRAVAAYLEEQNTDNREPVSRETLLSNLASHQSFVG